MSEMVERVATAINAAGLQWKSENGGDDASIYDCPDEVKARAAIEAMREPTSEMLRLGDVYVNGYEDMRSVGECYRAMIDEALR